MYNVGIIGCGAILIRHIEAINENDNFNLVALCESDRLKMDSLNKVYNVKKTERTI